MKKLIVSFAFVLILAGHAHAQTQTPTQTPSTFCSGGSCTYTPLEPIPGLPNSYGPSQGSFSSLIGNGFRLLIGAGAIIAVVMIVIGALTYMFSDVVGNKTKALARIRGAMWGIVLLVSSYLILVTINPELVKFNLNLNPFAPVQSGSTQTTNSTNAQAGVSYPAVSPNSFDANFGYPVNNIQLTGDTTGTAENKDKLQQFEDQCKVTQHGIVKVTGSDGINSSTYSCYAPQYSI